MSEVVLFHWHPRSTGLRQDPHLHLGSSQLTATSVVTRKTHVPSGRIAFESVIELLIAEFNVVPQRPDWAEVLQESLARFTRWRTWS